METKPSVYRLARAKSFLKKNSNRKFISLEDLSKGVGVYSDVLANDLVFFEPMILMDPSLNMHDLLPTIESYLLEDKEKKAALPKKKRQIARKKELDEYKNYVDFIYQKLAGAGGLLSPTADLNDHDLHVLNVLVRNEVRKRRKIKKSSVKHG